MLGLVRHQAQASDPQILDNRACRPQRPACNFCNAQSGSSRGDRRVTVAVQPEPQRHPPSPASVPDRTEAREPPACQPAASSSTFPEIPWDVQKIVEVMTLWMFMFFLVGGQTATMVPRVLGTEALRLATYGHALGYCICDLTNLLLTLTVITQSVRPHKFWKMGLFDVKPTASMLLWVAVSCLTFPIIDRLSHVSQAWFVQPPDALTSPLEQSITYGNTAANVLYFFVVSVCTPVWEEAIFRGFLLSSLTKYMPAVAAILASSLAFMVAHFSIQRSLYLTVLGFIFGFTFVKTRNLLTPILVHSFWNFYVFWKVAVYPSMMPALATFLQSAAGSAQWTWQHVLALWPT